MRRETVIGIALLVLTMVSTSWNWPPPAGAQQPTGPPLYQGAPAQGQQYQGFPQGNPGMVPPGGFGNQSAQGYQGTGQPGFPQYPYPANPNPFFDGTSGRNFLANTMDWLLSLPSNLLDRFSNYVDGTVFPQVPATHGQAPNVSAPQPQPQGSLEPLPPASRYTPRDR